METFFQDEKNMKILSGVSRQLRKYFAGCDNDNTYTTVVENQIANRLLTQIAKIVAEDEMRGGQHSLQKVTIKNSPFLMVDKVVFFTNYQVINLDEFANTKQRFTLENKSKYDRIKEGNKTLDMMEELEKVINLEMDKKDFIEKWYEDYKWKETDYLLKTIFSNLCYNPDGKFNELLVTENRLKGFITFEENAKMATYNFLMANDRTVYSDYCNKELMVNPQNKNPANSILIEEIKMKIFIEREDFNNFKNNNFFLKEAELILSGKEKEISIKIDMTDKNLSLRKEIGNKLYDKVYQPKFEHDAFDNLEEKLRCRAIQKEGHERWKQQQQKEKSQQSR